MIKVTDQQFWIDKYLKEDLDSLIYNVKNDWDFVICISGDGRTRVGKSHLGQQIAYYLDYEQGLKFTAEHIVFSGDELRKIAPTLPKGSVIMLDEGRAELDSKKTMHGVSMDIQDYFAECGMYNHIIIVILPDFFELNKNIALNRSEFLINVYVDSETTKDKKGNIVTKFKRGGYEVYNRKAKRKLYYWGKKNAGEYNSKLKSYFGDFREKWLIDREVYEARKLEFLQRTRKDKTGDKYFERYIVAVQGLKERFSIKEIEEMYKLAGVPLSKATINRDIAEYAKKSRLMAHEGIKLPTMSIVPNFKTELEHIKDG